MIFVKFTTIKAACQVFVKKQYTNNIAKQLHNTRIEAIL
jgi:hypothetical protein